MESIIFLIQSAVREAFALEQEVSLSRPDAKFGDWSTNVALQLSSKVGLPARQVADTIAEILRQKSGFDKVEVAGPGFINLTVSAKGIYRQLSEVWTEHYGTNHDGAGKTVVVEFPSPNVAKPYSVGHLRPGNQGWSAKKLLEVSGWRVITDNHIGDAGSPFGVWVVGFLRFSDDDKLAQDGVYELGRVYIEARKLLKLEESSPEQPVAGEVQQWLQKLEQNEPVAVAYSEKFKQISMDHIHAVMDRLNISTDFEYGESFFVPMGKQTVNRLVEEGVATTNADGSVIVPLDDQAIKVPMLVQKSNGTSLYATTDIATILFREKEWNPDKVIYVVGAEQDFYFKQLFAVAKKLGIQTNLYHMNFGVIDQLNDDGTREKMSSRKGVVLMEDLLNQAEAKAREVTRGRDISDSDIKKIALGAIKFSDFVADRRTNILFDWQTIFALTGFSGPYVQYSAVRVNKIRRDNSQRAGLDEEYDYQAEKAILNKLVDYPEIVRLSSQSLESHRIATYLYELARELNRYYERTPVATSQVEAGVKACRLDVLDKVAQVFCHGLGLLGIEVPTRM